jgi:hypothetical protein
MQQNASAYNAMTGLGQKRFNEAAFDRDEALYNGELLNRPFRAVAKSFQVAVWQDLCADWQKLPADLCNDISKKYPVIHGDNFQNRPT